MIQRRAAAVLFACVLAFGGHATSSARGADEGAAVFQKCYACHSVQEGETGLPGPNLRGVIGRRAAFLPDFEYSPAMIEAGRSGLVWTESTLETFLADPRRALLGTAMSFVGLPAESERAAVIDYLKRSP